MWQNPLQRGFSVFFVDITKRQVKEYEVYILFMVFVH